MIVNCDLLFIETKRWFKIRWRRNGSKVWFGNESITTLICFGLIAAPFRINSALSRVLLSFSLEVIRWVSRIFLIKKIKQLLWLIDLIYDKVLTGEHSSNWIKHSLACLDKEPFLALASLTSSSKNELSSFSNWTFSCILLMELKEQC